MAVKRCLSMSHTHIATLLLVFFPIVQRASSSQFHGIPPGYCPGWNFTWLEHDIVSGTVSSIGFRFRRSTWSFLYKKFFKNRWICLFCTERYIVDTLASQRTWRILSVIRCPCITFTSVRRRIYVGGHVGLDSYWPICKVGGHLFFSFFNRPYPPFFFV